MKLKSNSDSWYVGANQEVFDSDFGGISNGLVETNLSLCQETGVVCVF